MINPHIIAPATFDWLLGQAENELNGYLIDGSPYEDNGKEWPEMARNTAAQCRAIAKAAGSPREAETWLLLATQYEETIRPEDRLPAPVEAYTLHGAGIR